MKAAGRGEGCAAPPARPPPHPLTGSVGAQRPPAGSAPSATDRARRPHPPFYSPAGGDVSAAERPCPVGGKRRRTSARIRKGSRGDHAQQRSAGERWGSGERRVNPETDEQFRRHGGVRNTPRERVRKGTRGFGRAEQFRKEPSGGAGCGGRLCPAGTASGTTKSHY